MPGSYCRMQFRPSWPEDRLGRSARWGLWRRVGEQPLWGGSELRIWGTFMHPAKTTLAVSLVLLSITLTYAVDSAAKPITITGYVIDSACAFTKNLDKPISADCAKACAKAGSPLVILTADGTVYWPIAESMPATGQNEKLLPFAAQKVTVKGKTYERGGSHALVIEKIEPAGSTQ